MKRLDGKNPFDPKTYNRPTASIKTMLELRAFCADFFDKRIRNNAGTKDPDFGAFMVLVCHSYSYFARARAVIPELQEPVDVEPSDRNAHITYALSATRAVRGPSDRKWDVLPEEPVWKELAKDGMDNFARNLVKYGIGYMKQSSDASAHDSFGQ